MNGGDEVGSRREILPEATTGGKAGTEAEYDSPSSCTEESHFRKSRHCRRPAVSVSTSFSFLGKQNGCDASVLARVQIAESQGKQDSWWTRDSRKGCFRWVSANYG